MNQIEAEMQELKRQGKDESDPAFMKLQDEKTAMQLGDIRAQIQELKRQGKDESDPRWIALEDKRAAIKKDFCFLP